MVFLLLQQKTRLQKQGCLLVGVLPFLRIWLHHGQSQFRLLISHTVWPWRGNHIWVPVAQPGHPWCCRGQFELCVHHISENHSHRLLNLVSEFEYKKNWVTVKRCAMTILTVSLFEILSQIYSIRALWGSASVCCHILWPGGEDCSLCSKANWLFWVLYISVGTTLILACTVHFSLLGRAWKVWTLCSVSS